MVTTCDDMVCCTSLHLLEALQCCGTAEIEAYVGGWCHSMVFRTILKHQPLAQASSRTTRMLSVCNFHAALHSPILVDLVMLMGLPSLGVQVARLG